ncbi:MAG: exodeoxyribonuclease III [Alphaproteobacteria bacterium]|nr:MAG: exodeoxyribonuclease III [Alphaproteobacteria bacterium]
MVKIATWNVNSIKARLANVLDWLDSAEPDVLLLQEIKTLENNFPRLEFETRGYNLLIVGQKAYNGVAIASRDKLHKPLTRLPGERADEQARYAEATTFGVRVASLYLPNGNPMGGDKYDYKLRWMARLRRHAIDLLASEQPVVLGGDYNVIPAPEDVYDPAGWENDALYALETRRAFRAIVHLGLSDAFRALHPDERAYTYWDYQGMAWSNDHGLRIDHLLLSPQAADRLESCHIDRAPRGCDKASDHTPIWCTLETTP